MERIEAANPSLTVGAPNLAPEFSAMFCKDFTIEALNVTASTSRGTSNSSPH